MVGDPELARLLRRAAIDREPCPCFVYEVDAYSASPPELVHGRAPAPDIKLGDGNVWVFLSPATYLESRGGEPTGRRKREVGGGGDSEVRRWHQENGKKPILISGKVPVGAYTSTFSYRVRKKNPDGSVSSAKPGWIMVEIDLELEPQQDAHRLVLCKIYMSNRTEPETSTAAAAATGSHEEVAAADEVSSHGGMIPPRSNGCESGSAAAPSLSMNPTTNPYSANRLDGQWIDDDPAIPVFVGFLEKVSDPQSLRPSWEGDIPDWVNTANGTLIWKTRDTVKTGLTCILLKSNITVLNIENTRNHDGQGLLPKVSSIVEQLGFSRGYMVANDDKMSLALFPSKLSSCELTQRGLDNVIGELRKFADVGSTLQHRSVISLIGNEEMSTFILAMAFQALWTIGVKVQMMLQASSDSKVMKISLVVNDSEAEGCVRAFHSAFFGDGLVSEDGVGNGHQIPESSSAAPSSSGVNKRKARDEHHPPGVRQERADTTADRSPSVVEHTAFPGTDPIMPDVGGNPVPVRVDNEGLAAAGVVPQPQAVQPEQPSGVDANHGAQEEFNRLWSFLDDDSPIPGDNSTGDPFRWFTDIPEPVDYQMFDDNGLVADVLDIPMLNAEAEQQGRLAEAVEGGSPVVTEEEEEVIEALIAGATPDELFGSTSRDMPWPPPELNSSLHVAGECQAAFCGLCLTEVIGPNCA